MPDQSGKPVRPLFFIASYPHSGGPLARMAIFLLGALSQSNPPAEIDMAILEDYIPWDAEARFYETVTGKPRQLLDELEIAAARTGVHALLAGRTGTFPVVVTQAIRGTFHGHQTINHSVSRGGVYVVRNPLDVAAAWIEAARVAPLKVIEQMMKSNRRIQPAPSAVIEPQGSWTQNVASWTAAGQKEILVLKFEDLVSDPRKAFGSLARHLAMPAGEKAIEKASGLIAQIQKAEGWTEDARDFRKVLQPVHARAIIEVHAIEMNRHGYLTERVLRYAGMDRATALETSAKYAPEMAD